MSRTAIIAGEGALASVVAEMLDNPVIASLEGFSPPIPHETFRLERLVPFFDWLSGQGVEHVTFAGAVRRPRLDPEAFDPRTASLVPRILAAMQSGDDAALREVLALFEEAGFHIVGTAEIAPDLVPGPGILAGEPRADDISDADRAREIVSGIGGLDIGQGAVVAQGLCLAVETLPGTNAMLDFVAAHRNMRPRPNGARGVFWKAPKPDQDRRIDLPSIGPETVDRAARAGLAGIAWEAGGVILINREEVVERARAAGVFLWAR
ncbi:LpxI family protein [Paracoccus aerodenitrificans]|uniref:LpxI family protein n=1 Tax=Paracoccus aerodenitrificans TaxID=3017781 RepID=UPI0022EFDF95|nr:UDP-2,3-diacylglucosamine diphosphatase LpxI [Paracoccus aerodenitrificans]WBU65440.1 UDP-2,3-diacylglucosamine diphosphatase LpxI [Paracoccus aerodenitrificans]